MVSAEELAHGVQRDERGGRWLRLGLRASLGDGGGDGGALVLVDDHVIVDWKKKSW